MDPGLRRDDAVTNVRVKLAPPGSVIVRRSRTRWRGRHR